MARKGTRMSTTHSTMLERFTKPRDPAFQKAYEVLCEGCSKAENVGGLTSAIITPRPEVKIILSVKDAANSKGFDRLFSNTTNRDQRNLVIIAVQLGLAAQPVHEGGVVVIQVERNSSFLEILILGINTESTERIRATIAHEFGFSIIKDDGHKSAIRIEVPRNWRC